MRGLIEKGHLYIGNPPLYGIFPKGASQETAAASKDSAGGKAASKSSKKSGTVHWAYSDGELNSIIKKHKLINPRIVRYKGLGEMNPETLWDTTLDPSKRTLLRIRLDDVDFAAAELEALMGAGAAKRCEMIQSSAAVAGLELDV